MTKQHFWWRFRWARCPTGWRLGRAASQGLTPAQAAHVDACAHCASELRALERLGRRARALPAPRMPATTRDRIVMALRSEAAGPRQRALLGARSWRWATAAALVLVLMIGAGTLLASLYHGARMAPAPALAVSHASVRVIGQATYERTQTGGDEIIRLESGTIELAVKPLAPAERLRVVVADATVEVRGTHFDVTATDNHLQAVHVHHGMVDVSIANRRVTRLGEGDQWLASPTATAATRTDAGGPNRGPEKSPLLTPPPATGPRPSLRRARLRQPALAAAATAAPVPQPDTGAADRAAFQQGWTLLREGDFMGAASAFADLERRAPGDAIVEDALFWRGVALGRAGQKVQARAAIASFVDRFPRSVRAGEARASLGWLLLEAGDRVGARALFERAAEDRSERVRASARSGLQQIEAAENIPAPPEAAAASR